MLGAEFSIRDFVARRGAFNPLAKAHLQDYNFRNKAAPFCLAGGLAVVLDNPRD
jgi:hypothetical protein